MEIIDNPYIHLYIKFIFNFIFNYRKLNTHEKDDSLIIFYMYIKINYNQ
jgi:hypothetical protein